MSKMSKSDKINLGLVPKLRFPEFVKTGDLAIVKFGNLVIPVEKRAGTKKYTLMSVTSGVGLITQIEKFGREIAGSAYKNYYVIEKNDFAYNKSATKLFPEGYISMLTEYEEVALPNSIFTCFRITDEECYPKYFDHLFHANYHGTWLRQYIEVGGRAHGSLSININDLWAMPVTIPKLAEQEKIADCLSSLDEIISLEDKKHTSLKEHKKGLMQKLFPAEGKTVPELRFKEFQNSPNWEEKELGDVCLSKSSQLSENKLVNNAGGYPVYGAQGIFKYIDFYEMEQPYISIIKDGAGVGRIKLCLKKSSIIGTLQYLYSTNTPINFLYYLLETIDFKSYSSGSTIPHIYYKDYSTHIVNIPSKPEQDKIAECLSSLDDLISAQQEKIETLKIHKKYLMQNLFPAISEVN